MEQDQIGDHCDRADCRQRDFLPFRCEDCGGIYCLQHRAYSAHGCRAEVLKDHRVVSCPLCSSSVHFVGDDPASAFDAHLATECKNPQGRAPKAAAAEKKKCARPGCKEKLTSSNTASCSKCRRPTCLAHRHAEDHACNPASGVVASSWTSKMVGAGAAAAAGVIGKITSATSSSSSSSASGSKKPADVLRETAAARGGPASAIGSAAPSASFASPSRSSAAAPPPSSSSSLAIGPAAEVCPTCSARFPTIMALIEHAERAHAAPTASAGAPPAPAAPAPIPVPDLSFGFGPMIDHSAYPAARRAPPVSRGPAPSASSGAGGGGEVCPQCGSSFADVVALVAHVEAAHSAASNSRHNDARMQRDGQEQQQDGCALM